MLDIYGFGAVLLDAAGDAARAALAGGAAVLALIAAPRGAARPEGALLLALARRWTLRGAVATLVVTLAAAALQAVVLAGTLGRPVGDSLGAAPVQASGAMLGAALVLAALAAPRAAPPGWRRAALGAAALALLAAAAAGSHAVARPEGRGLLFLATLAHQAGAALWLGGLPPLLDALRRLEPAPARQVGRAYSRQAAAGAGLVLLGVVGFWDGYLGEPEALYGTAYGAMAMTKAAMLALLLALGGANFLLLHRADDAAGRRLPLVRRFVECEIALGLAVFAAAASITSLPPAVDLREDRLTLAEIVERFTPRAPRLVGPDHATLAISALQARLEEEARRTPAARAPAGYVPGAGEPPPRNAQNVAWSEYNHNWSGLLVLLVGLAALLDASRRIPLARHWPLVFLGLAGFILVRSDPEVWPLGPIDLITALRDPEVVQHKLAGLLVAAFALSEWGVRLGRLRNMGARFVFPLAMVAGGVLLLAHSHAIADRKEALLVELSHLPLAVLAVAGGCARWTELRGPEALARPARWIWPACLILVGTILTFYRES
nr:CopD family protein [Caldovatus aquaticus]